MKKILAIIAMTIFCYPVVLAQMVLQYQIDTINTVISLPLNDSVNVRIDWGDSNSDTVKVLGVKSHTYNSTGLKTVTISGSLTRFGIKNNFTASVNLIRVTSWENLGLTSLSWAFAGATALTSVPASLPTSVTDLSYIFCGAYAFNQPLGSWNTVNVTDMRNMFQYIQSFNQPLGSWNTTNVTNMSSMFDGVHAFNQPIGTWNTAHVTDMHNMFQYAWSFNQPIGSWNTANVTDMTNMFTGAQSFNQPIGTWNTANVTTMFNMFTGAYSFNQPLGMWNTGNVTTMANMFQYATSFNQPIGSWNITKVADMHIMLHGDSLCTSNYDNLLNGWAAQAVISGVKFDGGNSKYSTSSLSSRDALIGKGWTITDGGLGVNNAQCMVTGVEDLLQMTVAQGVDIFPNPSSGQIIISSKETLGAIAIYNSLGDLVYQTNTNATQQNVELTFQEKGLYIVKVGKSIAKLVKE
jgi:surface protein